LEIERTRFGERLRYTLAVPPELGDAEVSPFVVQTLVENSVKYAVVPSRASGGTREGCAPRDRAAEAHRRLSSSLPVL
jgi:LytS/YehU family sensor histidine kinase